MWCIAISPRDLFPTVDEYMNYDDPLIGKPDFFRCTYFNKCLST